MIEPTRRISPAGFSLPGVLRTASLPRRQRRFFVGSGLVFLAFFHRKRYTVYVNLCASDRSAGIRSVRARCGGGRTMNALSKAYPPYAGDEPYLHFCFSEASGRKALALLRRLRTRGVRVWYCPAASADRKEREANERRMRGARLTVVYLDEAFRNDPAAKSRLLTCQRDGQRIVCLNTDRGDGGLSVGLHANAYEAKLSRGASADEAERALIRAEGFSQELIGAPETPRRGGLRILTGVTVAVTVLLLAAGALRYLLLRPKTRAAGPDPADTVTFSNADVREAVRGALGGGALTEERLNTVTVLRLEGDALPDDLSDLSLLPSLETIELTQTAAQDVYSHPALSDYTLVLIGGASG